MDDRQAQQQIENELRAAAARVAREKPRVSTGKLKPIRRGAKQESPVPVRPRKAGGKGNLRRLPDGPSHDPFDLPGSPENERPMLKVTSLSDVAFSPTRNKRHHAVPEDVESRHMLNNGTSGLMAPTAQKSPRRSPRKRAHEPVETLANAVEESEDSSDDRALSAANSHAQVSRMPSDEPETTGHKVGKSRSSKPTGQKARERANRTFVPPAQIPKIKKIRPQSLFVTGEDSSEALSEHDSHPNTRHVNDMPPVRHHDRPTSARQYAKGKGSTVDDRAPEQRTKLGSKATRPSPAPARAAKKPRRNFNSAQAERLFGQQGELRKAYMAAGDIGWSYKDDEKHTQSDIDLDDEDVVCLKKHIAKAKAKLSNMVEHPDDAFTDPPEEFQAIHSGINDLENHRDFRDENKVNNIYVHLFGSLVGLLQHTVDCYHDMDREIEGWSPNCSITLDHLAIVASLIKAIVSLHTTVSYKYCSPQRGLCVVQPVRAVMKILQYVTTHLRAAVQDRERVEREVLEEGGHNQSSEATAALIEQQREQEELIARHAEIHRKWVALHEERYLADASILSRWKLAHLRVPDSEPDHDGNGQPFERLEIFAPRVGPSPAAAERARREMWRTEELMALRLGLEEFAGERVFIDIFRKYCRQHQPLNARNVTEIVTTAADLLEWESVEQQRRFGAVAHWVQVLKPYMWTGAKSYGGQENDVGR